MTDPARRSAWSPLAAPLFRAVWGATVVSNVGTWLAAVGTTWLMTELAPSALLVSLVQAASTLPIFLLALPAGALADIVDRRRLLIATQVFMGAVSAVLGLAALVGAATPALVLLLTFLMGVGGALSAPAFQAIVPDLVAKPDLKAAVALNSVGINVARAIGPALAGVVIAGAGIGWTFLLNAASFIAVIVVFRRWRAPAAASPLPAERLVAAMRAGLRFARGAPALRATLVRAAAFFFFAGSYWALLPLVARDQLRGGAGTYSLLLAALGAGAVLGALGLPWLRARVTPDGLVLGAGVATAGVVAALAAAGGLAAATLLMLLAGALWVAVLSSLNVAAQVALPAWVKARGLSVYLVVLNGALALGSPLWGLVAARLGIPAALLLAAAGLAAASLLVRGWRLPPAEPDDLTPARAWQVPAAGDHVAPAHGPVMVQIAYRIDPARRADFAAALAQLGRIRRRDGAITWQHLVDAGDPARHVEVFMLETWLEHLRQHERMTRTDLALQDAVRAFHVGDAPAVVTHLVPASGAGEP